ncbi:cysteine dioxygenase family protein [Mycobacterium yunnanensis]|uniref:Cysteine dioxygenase family protein n=1 Tax=Mycobacterium yunnanensis TaxID=368477 RepID=A0A9X3C3C2_9MYCO|nr:cysteine dioxygenase family protein [Mycobacterium yunnanensis]MCV7422691.1 cysteine dioxygenase family protein [Mycobacterium yunnanensis]
MSLAFTSAVAPTRLRIPDLLQATDVAADHVLSGRYDHVLPVGGPPTDERWFTRLHGDDELDVWLISWVPERSTELHDHGGSLGAVTVVSGALVETRWDGDALRQRRLEAGDQAGFPLGWVHDVVWAPSQPVRLAGPKPAPTLSVHAYSPPLTAMSYYEVTDRNTLRRERTELTDKPEGD